MSFHANVTGHQVDQQFLLRQLEEQATRTTSNDTAGR